jgi:hypothetical protein
MFEGISQETVMRVYAEQKSSSMINLTSSDQLLSFAKQSITT